jgi:hypothetical protein
MLLIYSDFFLNNHDETSDKSGQGPMEEFAEITEFQNLNNFKLLL